MNNILTVEDMSIKYGNNEIIREPHEGEEINKFHIDSGEIIIILGENGTGKSSILNAIIGNVTGNFIAKRRLLFKGEEIDDKKLENFKKSIAFCTQDDDYDKYFSRNVYENAIDTAAINLKFNGINSRDEIKKEVDKIYNKLKCDEIYSNVEFKKMKLKNCSGGQRKLASLFACLSRTKADLYILDEPLNNLDGYHARILNDYLVRLTTVSDINKTPPGVLIITHCPIFQKVSRAYRIVDRTIIKCNEGEYEPKDCYGKCPIGGIYYKE